jgi:hypothetical protein
MLNDAQIKTMKTLAKSLAEKLLAGEMKHEELFFGFICTGLEPFMSHPREASWVDCQVDGDNKPLLIKKSPEDTYALLFLRSFAELIKEICKENGWDDEDADNYWATALYEVRQEGLETDILAGTLAALRKIKEKE